MPESTVQLLTGLVQAMTSKLTAVVGALAGGIVVLSAPTALAAPAAPDQDQVFFDELARGGLRPDYDKQICGSIKCESLGELLVAEGHAICTGLGSGSAPLVPIAVIEYLDIAPDRAAAFIDASRAAYCPQAPDPYAPQR